MAWRYILECSDGSFYVGSTKDLEYGLFEHQQGKGAKYTSRRLPVKPVYVEEYEKVSDAYARGKQVQNWSRVRREALKIAIKMCYQNSQRRILKREI